ncbi:MAG: riboflavin synthase [Kiritimatiellia bacterium]|jgi:riboflavin synthase|nr:riboflavin synthase [Kiritimatiellia bacterium]MDP6631831.1 riboflavin synthase [Kiritimatiellia bacterium]MDP6811531.1 riboflavin synthase [Kiritimatiellia bacterium]MDP6971969.1 riboflavin synthase [Pseudomonadales bacterium]
MFTGLIEQVGEIGGWEQSGPARRLTIKHEAWGDNGLCVGDSVAVNGACLTAETVAEDHFVCSVLDETVARTSLAGKSAGAHVNLERAMAATARFGGHMVQGHVDAIGHVHDIRQSGGDRVVRIGCPKELMSGIVEKGSVALDGISLTVVGCGDDWFEVHIIPHTWANTALADLTTGDAINIETDIIGKYVQRHLAASAGGTVTEDKLRASGNWVG